MEVTFNNLQDNLVYRANIFNYDKQFLSSLISRDIKINFTDLNTAENKQKEIPKAVTFLKYKSKKQIDLITYGYQREFQSKEDKEDAEELDRKTKEEIQGAVRTLRLLYNLLMFSLKKVEDKAKSTEGYVIQPGEINADNITACLLFFDGISMANVDLIKLIDSQAHNTGMSLQKIVFRILENKNFDYHLQEIASHILSLDLMIMDGTREGEEGMDGFMDCCKKLMHWTYEISVQKQRQSCLTSNYALLLTIDDIVDYFLEDFNKDWPCLRKLFDFMTEPGVNFNIIYEALLCLWNISNNKRHFDIFEKKENKYIEKIVQVIRTNKIDKVARIGLMTLMNLLESQICVEILFDIKFKQTVSILLTNKWNDTNIKESLNYCYDFLEKNYKAMK